MASGRNVAVLLFSFLIVWIWMPVSSFGQDLARAEVRERLKNAWEGLGTFSFHVEERPASRSWTALVNEKWTSADYVMDPDGRLSMRRVNHGPSGIERVMEFRIDGHRRYQTLSVAGHPDEVDILVIENCPAAKGVQRYLFALNLPLWIIFPGGKSVYEYLDEGAILKDASQRAPGAVDVVAQYRRKELRLELDPTHGWLPGRVHLEDGFDLEVTRFELQSGHWFPVEGRWETSNARFKVPRQTFAVSGLKTNIDPSDSYFARPGVPRGTIIQDKLTGKSRIEGGGISTQARLAKAALATASGSESRPAIIVPHSDTSFPWSSALTVASIIALLAAVALLLRRNQGTG